jgi:hypothetical protein
MAQRDECTVEFVRACEVAKMIYIVSGLPRSGTSMMMKMLEAGGLPVLVDADNPVSENHPIGTYEYKPCRLTSKGWDEWMPQAEDRALKILIYSIRHLPAAHSYKVLFMERNLSEIVMSQRKMGISVGDEYLLNIFIQQAKTWIMKQNNIEMFHVNYNEVMKSPIDCCKKIVDFLGIDLDVLKMSQIPKKKLYRNKIK